MTSIANRWIKFRKSLVNDPRVLRMASRLCHGDLGQLSRARLTVLGALAVLWCFADEHIRDDDHIECTADEVNEVIGLADFCALLPPDWFQILDSNCVHLPDFLAHNGIEAKRRAVDQIRQQRHRAKRNASVTAVSRANRDQTETETETEIKKETSLRDAKKTRAEPAGTRLSEDWKPTPDDEAFARQQGLDPAKTAECFRDYWIAAPGAKGRKADWAATWRTWCRREAVPTNGSGTPRPRDEAAWAEAKTLAKEIGFRVPIPHESVTAYAREVKAYRDRPAAVPIAERRGLAGLKRISA